MVKQAKFILVAPFNSKAIQGILTFILYNIYEVIKPLDTSLLIVQLN